MGPPLLYALVILAWTVCPAFSLNCPEQCRCKQILSNSSLVDCRNSGLASLPQFPPSATDILLSGNQITVLNNGSFASAPFLQRLDLSDNQISTIELGAFVSLGSLERLDLSSNSLDADDFKNFELFRGCKQLKELDLSKNRLASVPPSGFKILTRLQKLSLRDNNIDNPVFGPEFAPVELLSDIDLSGNRLTRIPFQSFQILKSLKSINISRCGIKSIELGLLNHLRTLHTLDISDNVGLNMVDLNNTIKAACRSPELSVLRLSNLNITDISNMLSPLIETDNIQTLDLSHNSIGHLNSADLKPAQKLVELNLSNNRLVNLTSLSLPYLKKLYLANNRIASIRVQDFEGASSLEQIDLSYNRLTDFISDPFSRNSKLDSLDLSYNIISSIGEITHLETLKNLNLKGNLIANPENLFGMYGLATLDLSFNNLQRLSNNMIKFALELASLDLSSNKIEYIQGGTFSRWCPSIINLSNNKLTSMDDWGLHFVQSLNVSHNLIQYINEEAFKDMKFISNLDISHNRLSILPQNMLETLNSMKVLDLSFNNLGGLIDGSLVKLTLTAQSSSLEDLSLASNYISRLPDEVFVNLQRLQRLDLSHNNIAAFSKDQFKGLGLLQRLDLSYNQIGGFNSTTIERLVSLKTIDLSGTKWNCDCSINEVKKWMESGSIDVIGYKDLDLYVCDQPGTLKNTKLYDITTSQLNCSSTLMEKTIILIIIGCTSFVILVAAAIIFWQHRWRLRKKLKKQHYSAIYEGVPCQIPPPNTGQKMHGSLHHHHHHHHQHPPTLPSKVICSDTHHGQAFV